MNNRAEELFLQAKEILDQEERAAFLAAACQSELGLLAQVQGLLAAESQSESYFGESELPHRAGTSPHRFEAAGAGDPREREGQWMERYRLLQCIGEDGFDSVCTAEQIERAGCRVAVKIIKQGMDIGDVIARFEAERQALAMMDHPPGEYRICRQSHQTHHHIQAPSLTVC